MSTTSNWTDPETGAHYQSTPEWRAQFLIDRARVLETRAERLRSEAREYRDLAYKLNPTS